MKNNLLRIFVMIVSYVFLFYACSSGENTDVIEINPKEQSQNYDTNNVVLYYADETYSQLIGVERKIDIPVSSNMEHAVMEALIDDAASAGAYVRSIINPATKLLSVSRNGSTITVVLSKEFLDWSFISDIYLGSSNKNLVKQLSAYAIVNSLVETTLCRNVQILVDRNDTGRGQRIRTSEIGFGEEGVLGPLGRDSSFILTAEKSLGSIFSHLANRDYISLYDEVAVMGPGEMEKPVLNSFVTYMQSLNLSVENYSIYDKTEFGSENYKIIMANYDVVDESGEKKDYINVPIRMVKENGVWKITYEMLQQILL